MSENETREALEALRKDAKDPTLSVGDYVFYGGVYALVTEIIRHAPGAHGASPIRNDYAAVRVVTDMGGSRWRGIAPEPQECGPDCKAPCCEGAHLLADLQPPESGYTNCACRDCMEIIVANNPARPELCDDCNAAGCGDPDAQGWPECQREDAYTG